MEPENHVVVNRLTALRLGLKTGDRVRLKSRSNPEGVQEMGNGRQRYVEGRVKTIEGICPGVVAISTHYGHWAYGANDVEVDSVVVRGDRRRGAGVHAQPIFRLDDNLRGTPLSEPIGGSVLGALDA